MFYRVQLDLFSEMENEENPSFYLHDGELKFFMELCFKNDYQIIVKEVSEEEYAQAVGDKYRLSKVALATATNK